MRLPPAPVITVTTWQDTPEPIAQLNSVILARVPALYQRLNDDRLPVDAGDWSPKATGGMTPERMTLRGAP
jgi:hypothetical protein